MAYELKLPSLAAEMEYGTVLRWLKSEGDSVAEGEPLVEVEAEKANHELESPVSGRIESLLAEEGDELKVGAVAGDHRRRLLMAATETREDLQALEELLLRMWQIRAFEVRAMELFEENLIRGSVHPYVGMEAIAVGACAALGPEDFITSTHRGHGHCIAKGLDLKLMMAEIIGREDGYCRGRGGSMHITAIDKGMLGADAIVAGSSAIAVGAAHGLRLQGRDGVVALLLRRRRREPGDPARGLQPRRGPVGAGRVHLREQRVGDLHSRGCLDSDRQHRRPRCGLRDSRAPSSTATTCSACGRSPRRRSLGRAPATARP